MACRVKDTQACRQLAHKLIKRFVLYRYFVGLHQTIDTTDLVDEVNTIRICDDRLNFVQNILASGNRET